MKKDNRNVIIDIMRVVFSILVVFYHFRKIGGADDPLFKGGYISVEFFFIVTGVLTAQYASQRKRDLPLGSDTVAFMRKKISAIFPYYLFALCLIFVERQLIKNATVQEAIPVAVDGIWEVLFLRMLGIGETDWINGVTWYLSSMFFALFLLYPLARRNYNTYSRILAPIICIVCMALLYQNGNLQTGKKIIASREIQRALRALGGISLGSICYTLSEELKRLSFTRFGKTLITLLELAGYAVVVFMANRFANTQYDYIMVLMLATSVTLSFSQATYTGKLQCRFGGLLGKFSLMLYLYHRIAQHLIAACMADTYTYRQMLPAYFAVAIFSAFVCWGIVDGIQKIPLRRVLLKTEQQ